MKSFNPQKPYNALPKLPPKVELETKEVLKACVRALRHLSGLREAEKWIPNRNILVNHIMPTLETRASSAVENIITTIEELFEATITKNIKPAVQEALYYKDALLLGVKSIRNRPLTTATVCEICSSIQGAETNVRTLPGTTLRTGDASGKIIYTPPDGEDRIRDLLTNWQEYIHADDSIEPLIKLAVQHYQFEAIHPFTDGNGRTGRILNLLYLMQQNLLDSPILYMSGYILKHRDEYYRLLMKTTKESRWIEWILFIIRCVEATSKQTLTLIRSMKRLTDEAHELIETRQPLLNKSNTIADLLFTQPYLRIQDVQEKEGIGRDTASIKLKALCKLGLLKEVSTGRNKVFVNTKLPGLLNEDAT